jgi:hypothetical protein
MVKDHKRELALYAMHRVFVEARLMAYENEPQDKIARFLDLAELLPKHFAVPEDRTTDFRGLLGDLAHERPHMVNVLRRYDEGEVPRW